MTANGWLQIILFFVADPRAHETARRLHAPGVRGTEPAAARACFGPVERFLLRLCGVTRRRDARTGRATPSPCSSFSAFGVLVTYALQRLQHVLPLNPQHLGAVSPHSSFNTAVSFTTNTNWQGYAGESTMSYLTQMAGLAWHNFTSAGAGICVALVLARGLTRRARRARRRRRRPLRRRSGALDRLRAAPDQRRLRPGAGRERRHPEPLALRRGDHARRREADAGDGAGRLAGDHQGARHQRRRLLQRQQRPPVREPDAAHQLHRDAAHLRDPGRA